MKFLESSRFEAINSALFVDTDQARIVGRIESYSCKMIGSEKVFFKKFNAKTGQDPSLLQALSPPHRGFGGYMNTNSYPDSNSIISTVSTAARNSGYCSSDDHGDLGQATAELCDAITRRTLFYLISTLNSAFADYDFSDAESDEFVREPNVQYVASNIDSLMSASAAKQYSLIHEELWTAINEEVVLADCAIYSYNPDLESDPFGEDGCLWSFNYFFYNRRMRRIVLFHCRCLSPFSREFGDLSRSNSLNLAQSVRQHQSPRQDSISSSNMPTSVSDGENDIIFDDISSAEGVRKSSSRMMRCSGGSDSSKSSSGSSSVGSAPPDPVLSGNIMRSL